MEEEAGGGGGIVHPVDRGRGALSLFDESGEQGVYRSPPKKNKKTVWHRWGGRCGAPPCRGIPFQYVKII